MSPLYTLVSRQESEKEEGDTEASFPFDNLTPEVPGPTGSHPEEARREKVALGHPSGLPWSPGALVPGPRRDRTKKEIRAEIEWLFLLIVFKK